jgi:type IV secretory pathway VirB3-like protein
MGILQLLAANMKTRVYTELQKPELIWGVPVLFLFAIGPIVPALLLIFGVIFFTDHLLWVLLCALLVSVVIYVFAYVATKIDPEWANSLLLAVKTVQRDNWPSRNGKHYYG